MKITFSASHSPYKGKGYYYDFKPKKVDSLQELGELMLTHSLCTQLFGAEPMPNKEGSHPKPYRKTTDNVIGTGNLLFLDIDNASPKNSKKRCKNPITLQDIEQVFKAKGWACVITPSKSSNEDWKKFHVAMPIFNKVANYKTDKETYRKQYKLLAHELNLKIDPAMSSGIQNMTPAIGREILSIVEGDFMDLESMENDMSRGFSTRIKKRSENGSKGRSVIESTSKTLIIKKKHFRAIRGLTIGTRINCPKGKLHGDGKGKGYAFVNDVGGITCNSCGNYHWLSDEKRHENDKVKVFDKIKSTTPLVTTKSTTQQTNKKGFMMQLKAMGMTQTDYDSIENQKYFVEQFLPNEGLFMLAGDAGSGKSWLAFMLMMRTLEKYTEAQCFFIDVDSGATYTKQRVLRLKNMFEDRFTFISQSKTDTRDIMILLKSFDTNESLKNVIIVVDSLVGITEGNINESKTVKPYLVIFEALRNAGATLILIHHTKKRNQHDGGAEQAGSFVIKSSVDVLYMVTKHKKKIVCEQSKARGDYVSRTFKIIDFEKMIAKDVNYVSEESKKVKLKKKRTKKEENQLVKVIRSESKMNKTTLHNRLISKGFSIRASKAIVKRCLNKGLISEKKKHANERYITLVKK